MFPSLSIALMVPVLIQSALTPVAVRILAITSPSTVMPPFQCCPPSVDTAHASAVIFHIMSESDNCGLL